MAVCLFCKMNCAESAEEQRTVFRCPRCGAYRTGRYESMAEALSQTFPLGRYAASHAIRRMQASGNDAPLIRADDFERLWSSPLPNPQRQLDLLILVIGDAGRPLQDYVSDHTERFCAEIGSTDDPTKQTTAGLSLVLSELAKQGLLEREKHPTPPMMGLRLTFDGWARYEHLKREVIESRTAFMAMGYSNTVLGAIVQSHLAPAVKETGFDLFRLDARPRPGIIDNRMRVDIRTAKFLICDLTDDNRGAYWEAGFAEGLGRPVFYTCERAKFDKEKSHFDTEHSYTVLWSADRAGDAADELKAAIRNVFPADAIMTDAATS